MDVLELASSRLEISRQRKEICVGGDRRIKGNRHGRTACTRARESQSKLTRSIFLYKNKRSLVVNGDGGVDTIEGTWWGQEF